MKQVETERLHIRPFRPEDWPDLFEYLSDAEVVRFEPYGVFTQKECKMEAARRARTRRFLPSA